MRDDDRDRPSVIAVEERVHVECVEGEMEKKKHLLLCGAEA